MHELMQTYWGNDYLNFKHKIKENGISGGLVHRTAQLSFWSALRPALSEGILSEIEERYCIEISSIMHCDYQTIIIKHLVEKFMETV